jgi:hypothetical protein
MRIESSDLAMTGARESLRLDAVIQQTQPQSPPAPARQDSVQLSPLSGSFQEDDLGTLTPELQVVKMIAEILLGHKVRVFVRNTAPSTGAPDRPASQPPAAQPASVWRMEVHAESEQTSFQAHGVVETADGRSIAFSAELAMSRQFQSASAGQAAATDPLVVNLAGAPAQVTAAKIDFDLNADGQTEKISFVSQGSGFLALDRNGDGAINDGGELFGVRTGNGFAELAAYDADGNGWIDENDPVFAQLRIWTRDAQGQDQLASLADSGIGALSTASVATPFALTDRSNALQAEIRSSGVYLRESGAAGTLQQLDLATG